MVSRDQGLSARRQCKLLSLARSGLYYTPMGESAENLKFMVIIDKQFLDTPWYGSRLPSWFASKPLPGNGWQCPCGGRIINVVAIGCAV